MARSMNQTLAWISALVLSLLLFGVGFGVFKVMVKGGEGSHGEEHAAKARHEDGHGEAAAHGDEHAKEEHGSKEAHDAHGSKDNHASQNDHGAKSEDAASAKDEHASTSKKDEHSAGSHEEKSAPHEPASHGDDEGEISADQFKGKEKDHHD